MLVEGLQNFLAADAGVVAQLGTPSQRAQSSSNRDTTNGIFPTQAIEQPLMPYIVYQQVAGQSDAESFQGTNALQKARWRFSCYGSVYKQAKTLAKFVKLAMITLNGVVITGTQVQGSWLRMEVDESEPMGKGTLFSTHVDFEIHFLDTDTA